MDCSRHRSKIFTATHTAHHTQTATPLTLLFTVALLYTVTTLTCTDSDFTVDCLQ